MSRAVERFEGTGVYYAATPAEALLCRGCPVIVVGGGNSAGQAAVFLAGHASRVLLLIRGDDLNKNMSSYLVQRIEQTANIELLCNTTIRRMVGNGHLEAVEIVEQQDRAAADHRDSGGIQLHRSDASNRLASSGNRARRQRIRPDGSGRGAINHWGVARAPFLLETSQSGCLRGGRRAIRVREARRIRRSAKARCRSSSCTNILKRCR